MSDELNPTERWLIGELFKLSQEVANFAVRAMGGHLEKTGSPGTKDEFRLGSRLVELGR